MNVIRPGATALVALALLAACGTPPTDNARLVQAHSDQRSALADPCARARGTEAMVAATDALARADAAWRRGASSAEVDHLAYLARQRVAIAREIGQRGCVH